MENQITIFLQKYPENVVELKIIRYYRSVEIDIHSITVTVALVKEVMHVVYPHNSKFVEQKAIVLYDGFFELLIQIFFAILE